MMAEDHYVIVGNGPAANQAAVTLCDHAAGARITMISRERTGYYRPDLLPDFIAGRISEEQLLVHAPEFYKERGIKLRIGQEVKSIDFPRRELKLEHKEVVCFDGLIVAVGAKPRMPEPLQAFEELMLPLKTLVDARAWKEKLTRVDSVLIIGGDLTSLAFTKALLFLNKRVSFVIDGECFWPVRFTPALCQEVTKRLRTRGVNVIPGSKLKSAVRTSKDSIRVETDAGSLETGAVGAFFGLIPDVKFLARSGLHIERGILVDEYLQTPFEGVYAAGDCAQVYHPELRDYWVSVGFANAKNLGRVAALNLVGGRIQAQAAPESIFEVEGISVNTSWWTEF
jgi:3-phenylpropionate/trans-cinnamate dioxygenase ferredoxin reductase subunit